MLGKLAITVSILAYENSSNLGKLLRTSRLSPSGDVKALRTDVANGWLAAVCDLLFSGHTRDTISESLAKVTFVVFNYDRCIEVALMRALDRRLAIGPGAALEIVRRARIIHPYGRVGSPFVKDHDFVDFGSANYDLPKVASSIRTYSESIASEDMTVAHEAIGAAEDIIFLGFGWHQQNIQLLRSRASSTVGRLFASTFGIINLSEQQVAVSRGRSILNQRQGYQDVQIIFDNVKCRAFLDSCYFRLS